MSTLHAHRIISDNQSFFLFIQGVERNWTRERPGFRSHAGAWERSKFGRRAKQQKPLAPPSVLLCAKRIVRGRWVPLPLSRTAGCGTGAKGRTVRAQRVFAPPVPDLAERGRLSGRAALSFDSFLWARKEKNAPPAGRQKMEIRASLENIREKFELLVGITQPCPHFTRLGSHAGTWEQSNLQNKVLK